MTPKIGFVLLAASGMLAFNTPAQAQENPRNPVIVKAVDGNDAGRTRIGNDGRERKGDSYQAGNEHASISAIDTPAGKQVLMFATTSKETLNGEAVYRRVQLSCTAINLKAAGPEVVVSKYMTRNNGNQYRQAHASTTLSVGDVAIVNYNNRPNNPNNTQRYAMVVGPDCTEVMPQTLIQAKNNDDVCANAENYSQFIAQQTANSIEVVGACGGNGNGADDGWLMSHTYTKQADGSYTVQENWDVSIENNEERTRMTGFAGAEGSNMAYFCGSAGNSQPSDKGVRCYGINTDPNGEQGNNAQSRLVWRQYIARREGRVYQTQPKLAPDPLTPNEATVTWTTIVKRNRRGKGQGTLNLARLKFSPTGVDMLQTPINNQIFPGGDSTHRAMMSVPWGEAGAEQNAIMIISSATTGSPTTISKAQVLTYNSTDAQFLRGKIQSLGVAVDNQWISNIYGNNPNTQGRNHLQATLVENPFYGVAGSFQSDVKTFAAMAMTPRNLDENKPNGREDKLALELVMVPTVLGTGVKDPTEADGPVALDPGNNNPDTDPGTNPGNSSSGNGSSGTSLGGCSIGSSSTGFGGSLALLGLALFGAVRRRRRS